MVTYLYPLYLLKTGMSSLIYDFLNFCFCLMYISVSMFFQNIGYFFIFNHAYKSTFIAFSGLVFPPCEFVIGFSTIVSCCNIFIANILHLHLYHLHYRP